MGSMRAAFQAGCRLARMAMTTTMAPIKATSPAASAGASTSCWSRPNVKCTGQTLSA